MQNLGKAAIGAGFKPAPTARLFKFFLMEISAPSGDREKINRRVRRDRRAFSWQRKKGKSF